MVLQMPVHQQSKDKLAAAEAFFAEQWLVGASYVNKTDVNKTFGRIPANIAMNKFFLTVKRGNNLSGKITQVLPKDIDTLPETRRQKLIQDAVTPKIKVKDLKAFLKPIPEKYDHKSLICVKRDQLQAAICWCMKNKKFQFIKSLRILMSQDVWEVFYVEKSFRYFAVWPFCLSNWPSELREMILNGVSFDFTNAIGRFTFEKFMELPDAQEKMGNVEYGLAFLENSQTMRNEFSENLGISEEKIKRAFHGFLNGASANVGSIITGKSSLLDVLSKEEAVAIIDEYLPLIKQLRTIRKMVMVGHNFESFIKAYFQWEQTQTGDLFAGTGLIMHDGIDGCSIETVIPEEYQDKIKIISINGFWSIHGDIPELLL